MIVADKPPLPVIVRGSFRVAHMVKTTVIAVAVALVAAACSESAETPVVDEEEQAVFD